MSKRTPGPFKAVEGSSFWTIETADGQRLANTLDSEMIFIGRDEFNHSEANARLFAASSDLFKHADALLSDVMQRYGVTEDGLTCPHMRGLAAAIAKAKGAQP